MSIARAELFNKAKSGNVEAFELLTEDYQKQIYAIALKVSENRRMASEMTQSVFVSVFEKLNTFQGEAALTSSIYKTAACICLKECGGK